MTGTDLTPVIVGIGEITDRAGTQEPRALIATAIRAALDEAPMLAGSIDLLSVVGIVSWRYRDIASVLAADTGLTPREGGESDSGGEKPVRLIGEAAARIARGELRAAIVCGGEALKTRAGAARAGRTLDWGPTDTAAKPITALDFVTPIAARYGLASPTAIYPLYEQATRHAWAMSQADADRESAELWSRYADAAGRNPHAWLRDGYRPDDILADTADNRLIAFPYRKLMVANPSVNQAAAVLLTSRGAALAAGIAESRLVHVGSGARADERADILARDRFDRSTAQDAVLTATLDANDTAIAAVDAIELYSCFPVVPKMARRALGLGDDVRPSIAGGLTFFGGPANNYMTHAVTAAVRAMRDGEATTALLYGQGEFVTKHAAILLGRVPFAAETRMLDVRATADPAPPLDDDYRGPGEIETFTIAYARDGSPDHAVVLMRTPAGRAIGAIGSIAATERGAIDRLIAGDVIGSPGRIAAGSDGVSRFVWPDQA